MEIVPILFAFDESMMIPAGVCISSLLESAKPDTFYDIFIIHNPRMEISDAILHSLPLKYGNCRVTDRIVDDSFLGAYEVRGITEATYYRLLAPELIPEYEKIIYSDVDVIFREDLSRYYALDIGQYYFGGVDNCSVLRPEVQLYLSSQLGLDYRNGYYYAGNLIINNKLILADGLTRKFRELSKQSFQQQDMDIINIACNRRFYPLGLSFCLTVQLYELILKQRSEMESLYSPEEITNALRFGTIHYTGMKPWKGICPNMDLWWSCYRRSIFFEEQFARDFWYKQTHKIEMLSLWKRIKLVFRYFRKGGRK